MKRALAGLSDECDESAHDLRTMIVERNNAMLTRVYARALTGHPESIRVVLAINKQFRRIFGLAAASKLDVSTPLTQADIRALNAELLDLFRIEAEMEGASDG